MDRIKPCICLHGSKPSSVSTPNTTHTNSDTSYTPVLRFEILALFNSNFDFVTNPNGMIFNLLGSLCHIVNLAKACCLVKLLLFY